MSDSWDDDGVVSSRYITDCYLTFLRCYLECFVTLQTLSKIVYKRFKLRLV